MEILYANRKAVKKLEKHELSSCGLVVLKREDKEDPPLKWEDSIIVNFNLQINPYTGVMKRDINNDEISKFIKWVVNDDREAIIINCDYVIQGSPIARFLARIYRQAFPFHLKYYNKAIYDSLIKEFNIQQ